MALPGTAGPAYPESLRAAGIEGQVIAQFVVDSTGRVELATFQVLDRQHPLFVAAVRSALSRMRYLPAEARGARVAQLVQQSFHFTVRRD
jgi:protein TonB